MPSYGLYRSYRFPHYLGFLCPAFSLIALHLSVFATLKQEAQCTSYENIATEVISRDSLHVFPSSRPAHQVAGERVESTRLRD